MRQFWISDIHGYWDHVLELLEEAKFNPSVDRLVVGGDMIDRGPNSADVLIGFKAFQDQFPENITVLKGNHEEMLGMWLAGKIDWELYRQNGGEKTVDSFNQTFESQEQFDEHMKWVLELPLTHEDEQFFYVHAGINPNYSLAWQSGDNFLWSRDEFLMAPPEKLLKITGGKKVVHGHTPRPTCIDTGGRIGCDLGAYWSQGGMGLIDLTNRIVYQRKFKTGEMVQLPIEEEANVRT